MICAEADKPFSTSPPIRMKPESARSSDVGRETSPPEIRGFAPAPNCRLPVPTMLIASENESLHDASYGA
jgi:hypothetical protein